MRRILRHRPSPALVVACLALTVALGGTSYAAVTLPRSSVGTAQLKRNAVTSVKVKNRSLLAIDFKRGQLPRGARGATGATGATGTTGTAGPQGVQGAKGADFTVDTTLQPGQTETGLYSVWGVGGGYMGDAVSFRVPLSADILAANVHFLAYNAPTASCPGVGSAAAGHLCVYERSGGARALGNVYSPITGNSTTVSKLGFGIYFDSTGTGGAWSYGSWAVTAAASGASTSSSSGSRALDTPLP
jgi:hypothetical protein